jgi:hypothetical protein
MFLTDAVDASDPLFDLHRVPEQIVVNQQIGARQVGALRRRVGANENVEFAPRETVFELIPLDAYPFACRRIDEPPTLLGVGADQLAGTDVAKPTDDIVRVSANLVNTTTCCT